MPSMILIAIWISCWFFIFGIPNIWKSKYKLTYWKNPVIFSAWFLFFAFLGIFFLKKSDIFNLNLFKINIFILLFPIIFLIKSYSFKLLNPEKPFKYSINFSLSKGCEILCQQIFIFIIINIFYFENFSSTQTIFIMPIMFLLIHLPLYLFLGKRHATILILSSVVGGFVFSYVYVFLGFNLIQTYLIHFSFYILFDFYYFFFIKDQRLRSQIAD